MQDNLAALIDDADAWADQFCSSLPGAAGAAGLDATAPIARKARAYRDLLYCRFADQAFSAARTARDGRPASTSSLIRSAFETFTHLFELRDHLDGAFARNSLDALDALVNARLFSPQDESDAEAAFTLGMADEPEARPDIHLPLADNDGPSGPAPVEVLRVDPGARAEDRRADLALERLMRTLIAIETSFDNSFRALDGLMARLDEMFGDGRHGRGR